MLQNKYWIDVKHGMWLNSPPNIINQKYTKENINRKDQICVKPRLENKAEDVCTLHDNYFNSILAIFVSVAHRKHTVDSFFFFLSFFIF